VKVCLVIVNVTNYNSAEMSNMTDLWLSGVFVLALNTPKLVFGQGSAPDHAGGAYELRRSPDSIVGWGRGKWIGGPPPHTLPPRRLCLDLASVVRAPNTNSWLRLSSSSSSSSSFIVTRKQR